MMKAKKELDKVIENLKKDSLSTLVLHIDRPESKELDEAAEDCIGELIPQEVHTTTPFAAEYVIKLLDKAFKAGAKWYKEQMFELPSDINDAANDYSVENASYYYEDGDSEINTDADKLRIAFVAGAKWQAEQGLSTSAVMGTYGTYVCPDINLETIKNLGYKPGDVIPIYIRKKED